MRSGTHLLVTVVGVDANEQAAELIAGACTLPTAERPLRGEEFGTLFAEAVEAVLRSDPTHLDLKLDRAAETAARDLTDREKECCSFFTFTFRPAETPSTMWLRISVPEQYVAVLDSIEQHARAAGAA
jgi:hypothetical protein